MAIRGPKPKDDNEKVTRHDLSHGWVDVPDVPFAGDKPKLPGRPTKATRDWWEAVSSMPHCVLWRPEDWQFALGAALLHMAFVRGDMAAEPKLREREKVMSTTLAYRRDNRIRYVNPLAFKERPAEESEGNEQRDSRVSNFDDERRRRLLNAE